MALPLALKFPIVSPLSSSSSKTPHRFQFSTGNNSVTLKLNMSNRKRKRNRSGNFTITNAIEKNREENELSEIQQTNEFPESETKPGEVTELGMEIKKAMEERRKKENETGGNFWNGVLEEVKEIEWPAFGKVVGTTGVVLGVIAGSSVVLLTVNAVLAELSDRVFAGKGVQDFFG